MLVAAAATSEFLLLVRAIPVELPSSSTYCYSCSSTHTYNAHTHIGSNSLEHSLKLGGDEDDGRGREKCSEDGISEKIGQSKRAPENRTRNGKGKCSTERPPSPWSRFPKEDHPKIPRRPRAAKINRKWQESENNGARSPENP